MGVKENAQINQFQEEETKEINTPAETVKWRWQVRTPNEAESKSERHKDSTAIHFGDSNVVLIWFQVSWCPINFANCYLQRELESIPVSGSGFEEI